MSGTVSLLFPFSPPKVQRCHIFLTYHKIFQVLWLPHCTARSSGNRWTTVTIVCACVFCGQSVGMNSPGITRGTGPSLSLYDTVVKGHSLSVFSSSFSEQYQSPTQPYTTLHRQVSAPCSISKKWGVHLVELSDGHLMSVCPGLWLICWPVVGRLTSLIVFQVLLHSYNTGLQETLCLSPCPVTNTSSATMYIPGRSSNACVSFLWKILRAGLVPTGICSAQKVLQRFNAKNGLTDGEWKRNVEPMSSGWF